MLWLFPAFMDQIVHVFRGCPRDLKDLFTSISGARLYQGEDEDVVRALACSRLSTEFVSSTYIVDIVHIPLYPSHR